MAVTDESEANGSTEWVTAAVASAFSGLRLRELERAAQRGAVRRKRDKESRPGAKDGMWLYYSADAVALAQVPKNAKTGRDADTPEAQIAKAQSDLFTKTALHLERSWALIHAPLLDMVTELRTSLKEANAEIRELHKDARESEKMRRELENDQHVRELAREEMRRDQQRKDEAFEGAKKAAKTVWPAVEDAVKGLSLGNRLRQTIDVTKIQALLDVPGMLDEREAALLRELFDLKPPAETVDATAEPVPEETPPEEAETTP